MRDGAGSEPFAAVSRREALRLLAAGSAALALCGGQAGAGEGEMLTRAIPASGERIPAVGLGTARTFDVGRSERARAPLREVLRRFVEEGGTLVDSSPMYGAAETVTGDLAALLGVTARLFLATKVWTRGSKPGVRQMEESMRRFRVSRIDLMQVHNLLDWRTQLRTMREWKEKGRLRYLGITHYTVDAFDELAGILEAERLDFVQLPFSIASREAEERLLPLAAERGVATLVNVPFGTGGLFRRVRGAPLPGFAADIGCRSWAQFFLKYVLSHPAVTSVIPATRNPDHLVDNMGAGRGALPDALTRRRMVEAWERL